VARKALLFVHQRVENWNQWSDFFQI
jgi:hypothetical protein